MLPPSSYHNIYYHILQYNKTKYLTKNYRLYAACRHFSYFGTVKDPCIAFRYWVWYNFLQYKPINQNLFDKIIINSRRKQIMYTYKTEILMVGTKWFSDKASAKDIEVLDQLINERATDGWELVTYDYMATSMQVKGAFVITFKKQQ